MNKYRRVVTEKEKKEVPENEIRVTARGRTTTYVNYASKIFNEKNLPDLKIVATGTALGTAVTISEILKRRFKGLHQITKVGTLEITDEYEPLEEGLDKVTDVRSVSFIEVHLSKEQLDKKDKGYQPPIPEDQVHEVSPEEIIRGGRKGGKKGGRSSPRSSGFSGGKGKGKGKGAKGSRGRKGSKGKGAKRGASPSSSRGDMIKGKGKGKGAKGGKGKGGGGLSPKGGKGKGGGGKGAWGSWDEWGGGGAEGFWNQWGEWESYHPKGKGKGKGGGKKGGKGAGKGKGKGKGKGFGR